MLAGGRIDRPLPCARSENRRTFRGDRDLRRHCPADSRQERPPGNADARRLDAAVARGAHEPYRRVGEGSGDQARLRADRHGHQQR